MSESMVATRCRCLRSKSSYGAFGEDLEALESTMGATTTYWCLKTMGKAGPDEHSVPVTNLPTTTRASLARLCVEAPSDTRHLRW